MSPSDSEDDDFELELEDDADGEEQEVGGAEDGTEQDSNTDSTSSDDDDDDENDNDQNDDNDMESRLQRELQESLAMEVEAELDADANELDAALLAAEPPTSVSNSHLTSSSDTLDGYTHSSDLPPLPIPLLPDQDHTGYSASPGHSRASSIHRGSRASSLCRGSKSSSPSSTVPSSAQRQKRSTSPASLRRAAIAAPVGLSSFTTRIPRSYTVEAICALPHPVPTHALASSFCMTHLLTGSDDGYIRDYDIFSAVNGKTFLSAPQRHHAAVVEGLMKSGQIKCWWENPGVGEARRGFVGGQAIHGPTHTGAMEDDGGLAPVYSLLMQSDALWALAGTDTGHINLFTVRQEPGKLVHVMNEHKGPVSAMSMDYGEKGFFSASWDGEAIQWDLNTGSIVRNFTAHNSQLTAIAVRPAYSGPYFDPTPAPVAYRRKENTNKAAPPPPVENGQDQGIYRFSQDDINMASPGNAGETNSLFGDDAHDDVDVKDPLLSSQATMDVPMDYTPQGPVPATGGASNVPHQAEGGSANPDGEDTKSDGSFDSLFGDDGDENSSKQAGQSAERTPVKDHNPYKSALAIPNGTQPSAAGVPQFVTFPVGLSNPTNSVSQQTQQGYFSTQTFSVQLNSQQPPQPSIVSYQPQPPQPGPPAGAGRLAKLAAPIPPPKNAPPLLDNTTYLGYSSDLLMTAFVDGQVVLWDRRVSSLGKGVGRLWVSEKTPPWCLSASWSHDGGQIYAGRRNGTVDVWDVRLMGKNSITNTPRLLKTLRNPGSSGVVSCLAPFPDCRHIATASVDNIRLWNVAEAAGDDMSMARPRSVAPFKIIPGHHGGYISQMLVDPGARFMITASSNRGWHGDSTRTVFVHDIKLAY